MQSTRVIYISGAGRSGTTVLNDILDTVDGVAAFGEIRGTWMSAQDASHLCGCGVLLAECVVWSAVVGPHISRDELKRIDEQRLAVSRIRRVWRPRIFRDEQAVSEFTETVASVYRSLASATGAHTVVDSPKTPAFALPLATESGIDMRVVHLVRDPRAVVASWSRSKSVKYGSRVELLERRGLIAIVGEWLFFNTFGLRALRRNFPTLVVRMEDMVADPGATLKAIRKFAKVDWSSPLLNEDGMIVIGGAHSVAGNPDRFARGPTRLRSPESWRTSLPLWKRHFVTVATYPVMRNFGYRA